VILVLDEGKAWEEAASGAYRCTCGGRLRPWGYARVRQVRQLDGSHVEYRPRRFACAGCRTSQVFLAAWCLPRRRDSAETVGHALVRAARGSGHRTIAVELGRPESTVRNWLRRAGRRAEWLRTVGVLAYHELEFDPGPMRVRETPLAQAVEALGCAAAAMVRRLGLIGELPWSIITMVSRGRLLDRLPDG
jgi:hypothetical protein